MSLAASLPSSKPTQSALWVKICGVTTAEAVETALEAQVDAIGFVFAPSVRRLDLSQAVALAAAARGRCELVAVTLHASQSWIDEILSRFEPDVLQADLHDLGQLRLPQALHTLPVLRMAAGAVPAGRLLYESAKSGSGTLADWDEAERLARERELILAGGLNAANVTAAVQTVRPFGVDVSSGVESAPGRKSPELIRGFVQSARAALRERT
jgi:phosphoribosylanthranilate isomerase